MDNLVNNTYLHSQKWTFLNHLNELDTDVSGSNIRTVTEINMAIDRLKQRLHQCEAKENSFYNSFKVTSAVEWSNKYLINVNKNSNSSMRQIIFDIINSQQMRDILINKNAKKKLRSREQIVQMIGSKMSKDVENFLDECFLSTGSDIEIEDAIWQIFTDRKRNVQNEILKAMKVKLSKNFNENSVQRFRSKENQEIKNLIKKFYDNNDKIININQIILNSTSFLRDKLIERGVSSQVANQISKEWGKILREEHIAYSSFGTKKTLITNSSNMTTGGIQEIGDKFSFDITAQLELDENVGEITNLSVQSYGQKLVNRYAGITNHKSGVESKIDLKYNFTDNEGAIFNSYNIQHKNSFINFYNDLETIEQLEDFTQKTAQLRLHGELAYSTYLKMINQTISGTIQNNEGLRLLSYLLVNLNVLNQNYESNQKRAYKQDAYNKEGQRVGRGLSIVQAIIDNIFSENIDIFLSDILQLDKNTYSVGDHIDFIIFKGRILIPMSYVYNSIIESLNTQKSSILSSIHVTSNIKDFSSQFKNMYEEKQQAAIENGEGKLDIKYNYTNNLLVGVGSKYGKEAEEQIGINGVQFQFNILPVIEKNLAALVVV